MSPEGHCGCTCGRTDLKHVCVGVVCVLHNDRVAPGQRVGDAVLAFVAECLPMERDISLVTWQGQLKVFPEDMPSSQHQQL